MNASLARLVALLMALALGAAACSSSDGDTASASDSSGDSSANGGSSGGALLDITAPLADGSSIDLSGFAGQDLMLWFWAPW